MYIKTIKFHFNTNVVSLKVTGEAAQRAYDTDRLSDPVVIVKVAGKLVYIPQSSILYTEVIPHNEANQLEEEIENNEQMLMDAVMTYVDEHYDSGTRFRLPCEYVDDYVLGGWNLTNEGFLNVGVLPNDVLIYVSDKKIIDLYKELMALQKQLDEMVGASDDK